MIQLDEREVTRVEKGARGSPRVLLVQSSAHLREMLVQTCKQAGLEVLDCATIARAQAVCRKHETDLIVADFMMEGFFADDLLEFLRSAIHPRPLPPALVLSRLGDADTRECLRPGSPIHGVLTRPTTMEKFVAWVPTFAQTLKRNYACMT